MNKLYQFNSIEGAIEFYLTRAPTRQKPSSIEPIGGCKPSYDSFDSNHPDRIWSTLAVRFSKVYKDLSALEQMSYRFWLKMYHPRWGIPEIADYHGVDKKQLFRATKYTKEALEDALIDCDLMPMPDNYEPASRHWNC